MYWSSTSQEMVKLCVFLLISSYIWFRPPFTRLQSPVFTVLCENPKATMDKEGLEWVKNTPTVSAHMHHGYLLRRKTRAGGNEGWAQVIKYHVSVNPLWKQGIKHKEVFTRRCFHLAASFNYSPVCVCVCVCVSVCVPSMCATFLKQAKSKCCHYLRE